MLFPRAMDIRYPLLCMLIAADISLGLRDIRVTIPTSVKKGDDVHLKCNYDLEGDTLYSIKWYKGRHEFYRYTPKENPAMKTFPVFGINVERDYSNASHVYLKSVEVNISGKFSCEVSADAPSFHTMLVSGDMEIVEIPNHKPSIIGLQTRYRPGDVLRANCSSYYSKPAANLTWTINGVPASPSELQYYKIEKNDRHLEQSNLGLRILVTPTHFLRNKMKLECTAQIHDIYAQTTEKYVEEDRPRILATGISDNSYRSTGFDGDGKKQNEAMLKHHSSGDIPSSSSTTSGILMHSYLTICWITFYICTICTILLYSLRVGIS